MARGKGITTPTESLPINVARDRFYKLVNDLSGAKKASGSLFARAVEVGPRGQGGVVLLPRIDADAAIERADALEARIADLEAEIEDMALARFVEERLQTPEDQLLSVEELAASVGRSHLLSEQ